ncbi:MAG: 6-bladed beta-propeller [Bryobacteraceae bacterium]|nr:6-bladed beta-propeller [Bryobacteraceae bacterium]
MMRLAIAGMIVFCALGADLGSAPSLPHKLVPDWAKLPAGWNFGECAGVEAAPDGTIWVFNRGPHPVLQFDKNGKMLQAWSETPVVRPHGIGAGPDGSIWLVDQGGHSVMKFTPQGRLLMVITNPARRAGDNDSKYAFNEPTGIAFSPAGDFYVSDGYVNARVIHFDSQGEYLRHWGRKGTGDGEFNLVHDVTLDAKGRVYVADRTNSRVQIFDGDGKFLAKWTDAGQPWGLHYAAAEDAIYMCDGLNNRIVKLSTDGKILGALSSFGKVPGKLDFAHHIAVDAEGSIYVVEIKNWRVQKFAAR